MQRFILATNFIATTHVTTFDIEQPAQLLDYLRQHNQIAAAEEVTITPLAGGVSNRTVLPRPHALRGDVLFGRSAMVELFTAKRQRKETFPCFCNGQGESETILFNAKPQRADAFLCVSWPLRLCVKVSPSRRIASQRHGQGAETSAAKRGRKEKVTIKDVKPA